MLIPQDVRSTKCVQAVRQLISTSHNKGSEINQIEILMNGIINYLNPRFYHLKARREEKIVQLTVMWDVRKKLYSSP